MPKVNDLRAYIIEWNNTFPLDREYRKKHNISFNSPQHRALCQIDIYMDWLEDQIFEEHVVESVEQFKKKTLYEKGEWLSERQIEDEESDALFDDIDITDIPI